jgi:hypothetical protein
MRQSKSFSAIERDPESGRSRLMTLYLCQSDQTEHCPHRFWQGWEKSQE